MEERRTTEGTMNQRKLREEEKQRRKIIKGKSEDIKGTRIHEARSDSTNRRATKQGLSQ